MPTCNQSNKGKFYYDITATVNQIKYCDGTNYVQFSPWKQTVSNPFTYVYTDPTNPDLKVGIGTATPEFRLSLDQDGSFIAKGAHGVGDTLTTTGVGSRFIFYAKKGAIRGGALDNDLIGGTAWNDALIGDYSTAFGKNSAAMAVGSFAAGGDGGIFSNCLYCTLSGGYSNILGDSASSNPIETRGSVISGGYRNYADGPFATIGGGEDNRAFGEYSTVGGGKQNIAGAGPPEAPIGKYITISGGDNNTALVDWATIGGGQNNTTGTSQASVIGGGSDNVIGPMGLPGNLEDKQNIIAGGHQNVVLNTGQSTIGGGDNNQILGSISSSDHYNTIAGGNFNVIDGDPEASTIAGGASNHVTGNFSAVVGGEHNMISGDHSTITGGQDNAIAGNYSSSSGRNVHVNAARTFAWGYDASNPIQITQSDAFIIATGNVGIGTTAPHPNATVDINSVLRLQPRDTAPDTCQDPEDTGLIYLKVDAAVGTSLCLCNNTPQWVTIYGLGPCN
ncbi:MAG: hypothetical protein A2Z88_01695 [Omnitrophica WOR_2 bacterium GWA2_47_8]|nr:MAG: hypothetical protein A2Z88_01695 [Omnitrophica WOR_2 bacterium GWA2_47_8]